jgi:hypothetical protein
VFHAEARMASRRLRINLVLTRAGSSADRRSG